MPDANNFLKKRAKNFSSSKILVNKACLEHSEECLSKFRSTTGFNPKDTCNIASTGLETGLSTTTSVYDFHYHMHSDGSLMSPGLACDCPNVRKVAAKNFIKIVSAGCSFFVSMAQACAQADELRELYLEREVSQTFEPRARPLSGNYPNVSVPIWPLDISCVGSRTLVLRRTSRRAGESFALSLCSGTFVPPDDVFGEVFSLAEEYRFTNLIHRMVRRAYTALLLPTSLLRSSLIALVEPGESILYADRVRYGGIRLLAHMVDDVVDDLEAWKLVEPAGKGEEKRNEKEGGNNSVQYRKSGYSEGRMTLQLLNNIAASRDSEHSNSFYLKNELLLPEELIKDGLMSLRSELNERRKEVDSYLSREKFKECVLYNYFGSLKRRHKAKKNREIIINALMPPSNSSSVPNVDDTPKFTSSTIFSQDRKITTPIIDIAKSKIPSVGIQVIDPLKHTFQKITHVTPRRFRFSIDPSAHINQDEIPESENGGSVWNTLPTLAALESHLKHRPSSQSMQRHSTSSSISPQLENTIPHSPLQSPRFPQAVGPRASSSSPFPWAKTVTKSNFSAWLFPQKDSMDAVMGEWYETYRFFAKNNITKNSSHSHKVQKSKPFPADDSANNPIRNQTLGQEEGSAPPKPTSEEATISHFSDHSLVPQLNLDSISPSSHKLNINNDEPSLYSQDDSQEHKRVVSFRSKI